ncbi:MAG: hypothetical protein ABSG69_17370 [Candidatus Acidiferrum sp.]
MPQPKNSTLTRREFTTTALLTTVGATVAVATPRELPGQSTTPPLPQPSQSESDQRLQTILTLYPTRFSDAQKADLKKICNSTQSTLDRLRAYKTANSDDPALHLKPLIEHERKPASSANNPQPAHAAAKA